MSVRQDRGAWEVRWRDGSGTPGAERFRSGEAARWRIQSPKEIHDENHCTQNRRESGAAEMKFTVIYGAAVVREQRDGQEGDDQRAGNEREAQQDADREPDPGQRTDGGKQGHRYDARADARADEPDGLGEAADGRYRHSCEAVGVGWDPVIPAWALPPVHPGAGPTVGPSIGKTSKVDHVLAGAGSQSVRVDRAQPRGPGQICVVLFPARRTTRGV